MRLRARQKHRLDLLPRRAQVGQFDAVRKSAGLRRTCRRTRSPSSCPRLRKETALRRLRDGIGCAKHEFGRLLTLEGGVPLEVTLPWLLARFARAAQRVISRNGQLMLGKK